MKKAVFSKVTDSFGDELIITEEWNGVHFMMLSPDQRWVRCHVVYADVPALIAMLQEMHARHQ